MGTAAGQGARQSTGLWCCVGVCKRVCMLWTLVPCQTALLITCEANGHLSTLPSTQMLCLGGFAIPRFYDPKQDPGGAHLPEHLLIQVLPQTLAPRRFPPLNAQQLAKGYYDSPCPSRPLAICFVQVGPNTCGVLACHLLACCSKCMLLDCLCPHALCVHHALSAHHALCTYPTNAPPMPHQCPTTGACASRGDCGAGRSLTCR